MATKKKPYTPTKKSYNDLGVLMQELKNKDIKIVSFNGYQITTKNAIYGLYDGQITMKEI